MKRVRELLGRWLADPSLRLGALLCIALLSVAVSAAAHVRGAEAALLIEMALVGAALAWLAAAVRVPGSLAAALIGVAGLARSVWRVGRLGNSAWAVVQAALHTYRRWLLNPFSPSTSLNFAALAGPAEQLAAQLAALSARLGAWLQGLLVANPTFDPLGAAFMWSALFWTLAAWGAWQLRRRSRPLLALLPLLALSAYTSFYTGGSTRALLGPLAVLLLLMAFDGHRARQRRWHEEGIVAAEGLGSRLAMTALPVSLALVAAAATVPSLSYDRAVRFAQRLAGPREAPDSSLGDSLGLQQLPQYDSPLYSARTAGLPNRHLIGSGDELSEQTVLSVNVFNLPIDGPPPRFNWKALTYDRYSGEGWVSSPTVSWSYAPGEPTEVELPTDPPLIRQKVRVAEQAPQVAFHAGHLVTANQEFEVAWRSTQRDAFAASLDSGRYEIRSRAPDPTAAELRAAGDDYPQWVRERYLELPDEVPDRVIALARDLTATAPTRYDRARLLVERLRDIPYDLDVPLPPEDRDVVDWFLFDLQRGYCDYYASAMVVMARAAGLPARFVVGYYTGTSEQTEGTYHYVVSAADAHSWVEIYFADYGWVEFDPTAGRPPIDRDAPRPEPKPSSMSSVDPRRRAGPDFRQLAGAGLRTAGFALAAALAGAVILLVYDLWGLRRRHSRRAVGTLYQRFARLADRLGLTGDLSPTPYELGRVLSDRLGAPDRGRIASALGPDSQAVERLIDLSVKAAYTSHLVDPSDVSAAWKLWWGLAPRLLLVVLFKRMSGLSKPTMRNRPGAPSKVCY